MFLPNFMLFQIDYRQTLAKIDFRKARHLDEGLFHETDGMEMEVGKAIYLTFSISIINISTQFVYYK